MCVFMAEVPCLLGWHFHCLPQWLQVAIGSSGSQSGTLVKWTHTKDLFLGTLLPGGGRGLEQKALGVPTEDSIGPVDSSTMGQGASIGCSGMPGEDAAVDVDVFLPSILMI